MTNQQTLPALMEKSLAEAVALVLGMERHRVDPKENLSSYGFDSITLTQLANRLNRVFPFVRLDASTFLEHTTLDALRAHLASRYRKDFEAFFGLDGPGNPAAPDDSAGAAATRPEPERSAAIREAPQVPAAAYTGYTMSGSSLLEGFDFDEESELQAPSQPSPADAGGRLPARGAEIAVIGLAGRFPGADNIVELWENLVGERNALGEVPRDRWDWQAIYGDPDAEGNLTDCRYGGFLDDPDRFDPSFFGIPPLEAAEMDPQQKLVLRAAWETIENAGYAMDSLRGEAVGVYLGVQRNENLFQLMKSGREFGPYTNIGNTHSMLANRVSYFFDWTGDSLSVDTACSASSSALHLACHALLRGEIKLALVGGVTVVQEPFSHIANRKMGLLTNEPRVRSFDRDSGGYLIGEGVATALLKPLAQAEKDGDYIYGVIRGCAVRQSGRTVFLTAPDPKSHAQVIRSALAQAGLGPGDIDYVEGQGTGTALSDKAELKAYAEVFGDSGNGGRRNPDRKLSLGSIKGNIGHVESASGITSLIKVCLAMKNGVIPPVLDFRELNSAESEEELPFRVLARKQAWERRAGDAGETDPRRAGIHNFGYGGLCAHFILEEHVNACERRATDEPAAPREELLVFSSKSEAQLDQYLARFLRYLQGAQYRFFGIRRPDLGDLAQTLQRGRQEMEVRLAVVASSVEELVAKLQCYLSGERRIPRLFCSGVKAAGADRAEAIPPGLYPSRAWDEIAERWVDGGSLADLAEQGAARQRIPLPNFCFASGPASDSEPSSDPAEPRLNPVAWHAFSGAFRTLEEISREWLLARFQAWGACRTPGEVLEPERLKAALGIAPQHHRLFAVLLDILARGGVLQREHDGYRVIGVSSVNPAELERKCDELLRRFPELETQIGLTRDCLDRLHDILTGQVPATAILFPDASMKRVEGFYKGNPVVDHFNQLVNWQLVAAIRELARERRPEQKIRILEIGAGTGGTTAGALKAIACFGDRLNYVYSDISSAFTQYGKTQFGADFPFLEFRVLDIEKDILAQGFEPHAFDLIVAANVLHATADMQRTLGHVRRLIKPGGRLILNEVTHAQDFISLTFGLLHGWWAFADEHRRLPGGPLLDSDMWTALLREQGFGSVEIYGRSGPDGEDTGYNVVVASDRVAAADARPGAERRTTPPGPVEKPNRPAVAAPNSGIARQLREIFAKVLMMDADAIDADAPYVDFGVDSFTAVRVVREIDRALGLGLRATELFNFPSIDALSRHIGQRVAAAAAEPQRPAAESPPPARPADPRRPAPTAPATAATAVPTPSADGQAGIAVIGMSGRFPGARNIDEFWRNLAEGRDGVEAVPPERWDGKGFRGGFVDDVDRFDPLFFNISPREAEWMDPQQRLFLQEAWRTFEHAGYSAETLKGSRCGVFVGCREGDYLKPFAHLGTSSYQGTGNSASVLAARIAYVLDLKGPSLAIDTACSSSLVALHLACESIRIGTCDLALAGGVSLLCTAESHQVLSKSGMLAPDGRCKTFDDAADGFVPAEAVGAVLLKPLEQALRDGDRIYGVIQAHGINQDGKTNGITASSAPSQSALQREIYRRYRIDPERIGYVEAHGTGTSLGDPIEIDALTDTFRAYTQGRQFCAIGSVKTNIGHTLAAAGVAGLIKLLLCLRHGQLPPSLHFEKENRHFRLAETPFYVNTELKDWERPMGLPRLAALSSFGFSGTNAHCVVEEAPDRPLDAVRDEAGRPWLIPLSAKTPADLAARVEALADWLDQDGEDYPLGDIATTLLLGRTHFDYRLALVASDRQALAAALRERLASPESAWAKVRPEQERSAALRQFGSRLLAELRDPGLPDREREETLESLADLYRQGYPLEWRLLYRDADTPRAVFRKVPLPTYPFIGQRYWLAPAAGIGPETGAKSAPNPVPFPPEPPDLKTFQEAYARIPDFCALLLAGALREMGAFREPGARHTPEELRAVLRIDAKYHRLLDAFLNILLDAGHLRRHGRYLVRVDGESPTWRISFEELGREKERLDADRPAIGAFLNLLWVCVRNYPAVLRGELKATEVMFPGSSFDLVKGIYRENATADFYNRILADNLAEYVGTRIGRAGGEPLRILEIGAGTGGSSALLLSRLRPFGERISYLYTDISSGFVQYGRRTYGPHYPFARFEVLDIEKPVAPECTFRKSFDIILAANVLHATRKLNETLDHVEALLKDGGCLFLNEATDVQAFATMTYGLLDGWWRFEDDLRLENSPLLDADLWVALLEGRGFAVAPPQGLAGDRKGPGQHILIARLNGDGARPARPSPPPEPATAYPLAGAAPGPLRQRIRQEVAAAIAHILGLADMEQVMEKPFSDYGLDSISGIDFLGLLNQRLGTDLRITVLFDYPSVAALSDFIHDSYREQLGGSDFGRVPDRSAAGEPGDTPNRPGVPAAAPPLPAAPGARWETRPDDIAIIGMSGRFSGTRNVREFWEKLASGVSTIGEPPPGRWPEGSFPPGYRAGFLEDIDQFDPLFFNWSGSEAEQADPQQRLFLEECYAALEDAGYPPAQLRPLKCGVFAGVGMSDYLMNMRDSGYPGEAQTFWGNSPAVVPARISYFLDLKGPGVAVDTACSSSLVAIHWARQSLLAGECDIALAGGAFLCTTPHFHNLAAKAQMLAPDGRCKAFDRNADGFVFGEGVGVIVLKRLDAALRDKDHVYGVLKASGVNQDGKTNGMTAPSARAQTELEVAVYEQAGIDPETISYVEAHGTGTKLGDPVEVAALADAFRRYTDKKSFCLLGSVKPNIGHASLAAGVAGVIKVLQAFAHRKIPPLLNFSEANEHIDFADSPFQVNTTLRDWETSGGQPRRAAVSGFGLGGTNAHLVLEESPVQPLSRPSWEEVPVLICLSAKTPYSLRQKLRDLADELDGPGRQYSLGHVAYTLHVGREHFRERVALVAQSRRDLVEQLRRADFDAVPDPNPMPTGDVESWMDQLRTAGLPLPEALERLHALAALYRAGHDIDWRNLYAQDMRYRVPLPSYPFERARYWFPATPAAAQAGIVAARDATRPETGAEDDRTWWQPGWVPAPPVPSLRPAEGPLLVFGDHRQDLSGWGGAPVVLVSAGDGFSVAPQGTVRGAAVAIRIRAGNPEDYEQLAGLLARHSLLPARILHGWSLQQAFEPDRPEAHLERGFYSVLFIAQALMKQKACPPLVRMIYAFVPSPSRDYALNQAIGGLAKTLNREHPNVFCQTLELPEAARLAEIAAGEFRCGARHEVEVRYRQCADGTVSREVRTWRAVELDATPAVPLALKEQGTYLLVGGAGGLGLLFCRYLRQLAERQKTRIGVFLAGRSPLSADRLRRIEDLSSPWCEVSYLRADVSEPEGARHAVSRARSRVGGIAGVFHFAGSTRDGFLLKKTREECREVLSAKVSGTLQLERALQGEKVDFVTFFSSASSVIGNVGQADYAYANAFLDAFAAQGGMAGSHTFSVNWALWRDGGMRLSDSKLETMASAMGVRELATAVGIEAWETVLQSRLQQCMFLSGDGPLIRGFVESEFPAPRPVSERHERQPVDIGRIYRDAERIGRVPADRGPDVAAEPVAAAVSAQAIEAFLQARVAEVTRLPADKIGAHRPLEEFGLDSLMITALNDRLAARFGPLPATLFFEYPTVAALAEFLSGREKAARPAAAVAEIGAGPRLSGGLATAPAEDTRSSTVADIYRKAETIGLAAARSDTGRLGERREADVSAPVAGAAETRTLAPAAAVPGISRDIEAFLQARVAEVTRLPADKIGAHRPLEEFGLDSLMITALNDRLAARFGPLPATLFFEYPTLAALAEFLSARPEAGRPLPDGSRCSAAATAVPETAPAACDPCRDDMPAVRRAGPDPTVGTDGARFDIAVIGVSGIYPEADTLEAFWDNLAAGRDSVTEVPRNRWNSDEYYDPDRTRAMQGKMYCKWGGFIDGVDCFDPAFFNISPREAKLMDPSERLFLQTAWAACEDAGYTRKRLAETCSMNVGVFAGISSYAYSLWGPQEWARGNWCTPCGGLWSIANRVSYVMNLTGPSYPVDTACSSSLSAIHQACASLGNRECSMAIAGGASFLLHPQQYIGMCQNQMLSPTGKCHSFGAAGDGFVPGEGVGAVLLKPLAQALADGDPIYAVIKGSSVNHGGRTNGYAVPNPKAQAELIRRALENAGVDPRSISYVEAHGTGTALGDPVEFEGLCQAWVGPEARSGGDRPWCAIGSVKSNIGHLNAAAGISGLTKILLQMKHRTLAPSLHARKLNPKINFADSPFYLQQSLAKWEPGQPRRAAISSFGAGGANAHVILEEYCAASGTEDAGPEPEAEYVIPISARNRERLLVYAEKILAFWERRRDSLSLRDFAYTLQTGREAMAERFAFIVRRKEEVGIQLRAFLQRTGQPGQGNAAATTRFFEGRAEEFAAPADAAGLARPVSASAPVELAGRWVTGAEIDWAALPCWKHSGGSPARRISLPTYPFDKKPCWYPETAPSAAGTAQNVVPAADPLDRYREAFDDLARLGGSGLLRAFQAMGCLREPLEAYGKDELKARIRLIDDYDRLYKALLDILRTAGYLEIEGDRIRSTPRVVEEGQSPDLAAWTGKHPELAANFRLLWTCLENLPAILQGRLPATEVIFPGSSMALVETVYKENAVSDYYNRIVAEQVLAFVHERLPELPPGEKLRLLEIGAGTGGTSAALLAALQPYRDRLHYTYTDVSPGFLQHGRKHYGHHAFVDFRLLDIEKGVENQGFALQRTDLVIAANVLHATRRLNATLNNVKALLRPGGGLILNEAVETHAFSTLTFGLLKGWWLAEDPYNRLPGSPLLSVPLWERILAEEGFVSIRATAPVIEAGASQNVLVAESDGRIVPLEPPAVKPAALGQAEPPAPEPMDAPEPGDGRKTELVRKLRRIVAAVIEVEPEQISPDCAYVDLGVDSILAVEIIGRANRELGIALRSTALFDHATVNKLAAHILERHGDAIEPEDELLQVFQRLHRGELDIRAANTLLGAR
ncbi:hypothetical protein sS8_1944 [Methylocaldum marinum]|uniref:Polyketide synthase n=1 Tax=Methylocaldum marinum TaxID=1432792 RepID=A0A250KQK7_9GAMM|nr:beta-ketoacyl synthase N-terminal-like domain-containing protein [Methylocaldum marinum]BBA33898.1 hypothetical protein sS8_1944 [Methylocaldum marinum]